MKVYRLDDLKDAAKWLMLSLEVGTAKALDFARDKNPSRPFSISGRVMPGDPPEIGAAVRVLRACICPDRHLFFAPDLKMLETAINQNTSLEYQRVPHGRFRINFLGSGVRSMVQNLVRYTDLIAWKPQTPADEPIGICARCDSVFFRHRKGAQFCSPKCRMADWGSKKGKAYFAAAQRRRRTMK